MPSLIAGLLLLATLSGCDQGPTNVSPIPEEPWPHGLEARFQEAEALRYELARRQLEAQRLRELFAAPPDAPPQHHADADEQRPVAPAHIGGDPHPGLDLRDQNGGTKLR